MEIQVYEIFKTVQGEGRLQGVPSILIRLTGCNLNCRWCDTRHFFQAGKSFQMSMSTLVGTLASSKCKNVIITGGEPLINPRISEIIGTLKRQGYHITIETNATTIQKLDCDLISMSPKLSNSIPYHLKDKAVIEKHDKLRINVDAINYYIANNDYQIKFAVSDKQRDFDEIRGLLGTISRYDPFKVLVMPLASSRRELYRVQKNIIRLCIDNDLRYANRLQLQVWGKHKKEI